MDALISPLLILSVHSEIFITILTVPHCFGYSDDPTLLAAEQLQAVSMFRHQLLPLKLKIELLATTEDPRHHELIVLVQPDPQGNVAEWIG